MFMFTPAASSSPTTEKKKEDIDIIFGNHYNRTLFFLPLLGLFVDGVLLDSLPLHHCMFVFS